MITLHVEAPTINELILKVNEELYGRDLAEAKATQRAIEPQMPAETTASEPTPVKAPEIAHNAPKPAVEETPEATTETPDSAKKAPTLAEVRLALRDFTATPDGKAKTRELFERFGARKLSEVDPVHYAEILDEIQKGA